MSWTSHTVSAAEAGRSVQEILTGSMGVSRRMIQRLTRAAGIRLNGRAAFLGRRVKAGDVVAARLAYQEEPTLPPVEMELVVAYEDEAVLVVDKPAGLLVHPVGGEGEATLAHGVTAHLLRQGVRVRARPVHRLDRMTSGLVLFARSAFVHQRLDLQLREHRIERRYLAFVEGEPAGDEGVIDAPIGAHPRLAHLRSVDEKRGAPARTRFRVKERFPDAALLELDLETGRTHQVRVHLAHMGHPLLGDVQYGGAARPGLQRQALHAARLGFEQPVTGGRVEVVSPLPADLERLGAELRAERGGATG